ncbi:MAG: restriction endonuclease subunit S [Rickettsiales bacterium]|jgi:hypothetical protein|nr:restriction endonuclease subunit S [Rickettsiales bacterium]
MELNTKEWKEFRVGELFDIDTGADLIYNELEVGEYSVVGHKAENNGVACTTVKLENYTLYNCDEVLSLGHIGNFFCTMQNKDFYLGTRTKALKPKFKKFNQYIGLFISVVINTEKYRFTYSRVGSDKIPDLKIKLPATPQGEPDFDFMERYIKTIYDRLEKQTQTKIERKEVDLKKEEWKEFMVGEIFETESTKTRELSEYIEDGNIPFVASGSANNGVEKYVSADEDLDKGNCISVSSLDLSSFYQEKDFLGRGHGSVNKLYNNKLNKYNALFLIVIIKRESYRYTYSMQCFLNKLKQTKIKLPTTPQGAPDFDFMENYIKQLPYSDCI